jgi:hypothetical protein
LRSAIRAERLEGEASPSPSRSSSAAVSTHRYATLRHTIESCAANEPGPKRLSGSGCGPSAGAARVWPIADSCQPRAKWFFSCATVDRGRMHTNRRRPYACVNFLAHWSISSIVPKSALVRALHCLRRRMCRYIDRCLGILPMPRSKLMAAIEVGRYRPYGRGNADSSPQWSFRRSEEISSIVVDEGFC